MPKTSLQTFTASEARKQFFTLVKKVGKGKKAFEITHRGGEPVLLVNKSDVESWIETVDILNSPEEIKAIRQAKKETTAVSHHNVLKQLQ